MAGLKDFLEFFEQTFLNHEAAMLLINEEEKSIVSANLAAAELYGYTVEELLKLKISEINTLLDEEIAFEKANRAQNYFESRHKRKDGVVIDVAIRSGTTEIDGTKYILLSSIDITQRKSYQTELTRQKEWNEKVFQSANLGIMIIDKETHVIVDINETALKMIGAEIADVKGQLCHRFFSASGIINCPINDECQMITNDERILLTLSGEQIPIIKSVIEKQICEQYYLIESFIDIIDRKKIEKELKESENRFNFAMEATNAGLWDWNLVTNEVFFSAQWKRMLGFENNEIPGKLEEWEKMVHPDDIEKAYKNINEHINGVTPAYYSEYRMMCKDGSYKWIMDKGKVAEIGPEGEPVRMIGTHTDITERIENEQEIKRLLKEVTESKELLETALNQEHGLIKELENTKQSLEQLIKERDKFFSIIAHDLKGPFAGLVGISDIMETEIESLSLNDLKKMAKVLNQASNSTYALLNELLEWARIQTGAMPFNPENTSIIELVVIAANLIKNIADSKNITLDLTVDPNLTWICDYSMIGTVIRNLISNAVKFSHHGGSIAVSAVTTSSEIIVTVEDNGIGISKKDSEKLFKIGSHYSTTGTADEKGTGLGLVLCKEFVEKHGGRIWVESTPGKGSKFSFSLPKL